eukprot:6210297-Pleurochrysis_carterae.AAC.1
MVCCGALVLPYVGTRSPRGQTLACATFKQRSRRGSSAPCSASHAIKLSGPAYWASSPPHPPDSCICAENRRQSAVSVRLVYYYAYSQAAMAQRRNLDSWARWHRRLSEPGRRASSRRACSYDPCVSHDAFILLHLSHHLSATYAKN